MTNILSPQEMARYNRHIILPQVGLEGQEKLKQSKVLCIGAGGLGCPITMYLAAAGVGTLGVVDFDVVEDSNLHRQIAHSTADIGRPKTESVRDTLLGINPFLNINLYNSGITRENVRGLVADYDIVVDGTDNFPTRYLVNDACVLEGKPLVYASIFQFDGQITVFNYEGGPCYRCLYPEPPPPGMVPSCAEGGVLGVLPGAIGVIQATETVKIILGKGKTLSGRLMLYDAMNMKISEVKLRKDKTCPACGENPTIGDVSAYEGFCGLPPTEVVEEEEVLSDEDITPLELKKLWDENPEIYVLDVREAHELQICSLTEAVHIPMGLVATHYQSIPQDKEVVVMCKSGMRSAKTIEFLREKGFTKIRNLAGGILRWADDVDKSLTKY